MRALCFDRYGEPGDVLQMRDSDVPDPKPGHIRIKVHACGLNPADWWLCRGIFPAELPRGIGLDVSGTVDAIGKGVTGVAIGDPVFGVPAFRDYPSAGAADHAVLFVWAPVPPGVDLLDAAAMPMAIETASRCLDILQVAAGQTVFVYGAGTVIGFAAVQMALLRGATVIAAAGEALAAQLRQFGATVTPYGEGMVERVRALVGGAPDLILDAGPITNVLESLVELVDGDPRRVVTVSGHAVDAEARGVRISSEKPVNYGPLHEFAQLAAEGRFRVPVARTFPLEAWRTALEISLTGQARGKLMLIPSA